MTKEKKKKGSIVNTIVLVIAFLTFIPYFVMYILRNGFTIPYTILLIFELLLLILFIKYKDEKIALFVSIYIIIHAVVNIFFMTGVISVDNDQVPSFYNQSVLEVNKWVEINKINLKQNYEYSDTIKKDYVISQDIVAPTLIKDVTEMTVTISLGPDPNKEIVIPSFIGLKYNEVLKYIEENHLSNVIIEYQKSEKTPDTVISQSVSGTLKRSDEITITFAISKDEVGEIEIIDFTGKTKLYATSWLEKYGFKVEIKEDYSDTVEEGLVIDQSAKNEVKNPEEDTITLTISMGKKVLAPDISSMSVDEINKWAVENKVKISYKEEYNDEKKMGDVISSSVNTGELVEKDKKLEITISKGKLEMIKLTSLSEFTNWAENNGVSYDVNYENSDSVKKDDIIKCSHETGQTIKKDDTVVITVSRGKLVSIPNFVGMSKSDIQSKCSSINLSCSFKIGGYTESTKKDIAVSQSKSSGTKVSEGTGITITLSAGIQEKVDVPSFTGKTKSEITSTCGSIGIKCSFKYASGFNDQNKDTALSQSATGKVNKGSAVTITLSNGPAKSYSNIIIQSGWLLECKGNVQCSKTTIENYLTKSCPGVTFKFDYVKATTGIGYIAQSSAYIADQPYTFTQGKTYTITLNTN